MTDTPLRSVLAANPSPMTLAGTRSYVVGRERAVIIDPGPAIPAHLEAVSRLLAGRSPLAIVVTHGHADHAGGAASLAERTGGAIWMAKGALNPAVPPDRVARWAREGDRLETDVGWLQVIETPGHAPEHLALLWGGGVAPSGGALFVGDLLMGEGDTTLVAPPEGDLALYLRSIQRLADLSPAVAYPTHGPPIASVAATVKRYRDHRRQRIEEVRSALHAEPGADLDRLVELIYGPDLDPRLRSAARGSMKAVLDYLDSSRTAS